MSTIDRAAQSDAPVLLRGETGTGKTVLARAIHEQGPRSPGPFVVVNCPTLSDDLLSADVFVQARGAVPGTGGTLFFDEIGELSSTVQTKLSSLLQESRFKRSREDQPRHAGVRIVAATSRDLEAASTGGRFRQDLFFQLNVIEIRVPPLRERPAEILPLARQFVAEIAAEAGRPAPVLSPAAEAVLSGYAWPGNVRELRNAIEHALFLWPSRVVEPGALPTRLTQNSRLSPVVGGEYPLEDIEREHIQRVIEWAPTLERAAEILGIDNATLWRKRKRYERHGASG